MSKDDATKYILDLIEKKAAKRKAIREGSSPDCTYVQEVLKTLNNLDMLATESANETEMYVEMNRECSMLYSRLKPFDQYVTAIVEWNDVKNWKDLRPLGVKIQWSNYYLRLNPGKEPEEYIDVSRLLLDDYD